MSEVERLLQNAFVPVEPPGALTERLERRLTELTDAAMGELAEFDPAALRDLRRWPRLVAAGLVAGSAGGGPVPGGAPPQDPRRPGAGPPAPSKRGPPGSRGERPPAD